MDGVPGVNTPKFFCISLIEKLKNHEEELKQKSKLSEEDFKIILKLLKKK